VSARCADAGDVAVGLLLSQMNGGVSGEIRHKLNSHLVIRASTGPAPAKRRGR
jgi:LacI family transcriptional regulator